MRFVRSKTMGKDPNKCGSTATANSEPSSIQELFVSDLFSFLSLGLGSGRRGGFCRVRLCGHCCCTQHRSYKDGLLSAPWHRLAFACTVMVTKHTSQRLPANAMLSIGFVLKSGTRLSRLEEAVSD